MNADGR